MRLVSLATLCALTVGATAASAQVTAVVTRSDAVVHFNPAIDKSHPGGVQTFTGTNLDSYAVDSAGSGASYQVQAQLQPDQIDFADGSASLGAFSYETSSTAIDITFTNDGSTAVTPRIASTIVPGGFGVYVANNGACSGNPVTGCPGAGAGRTFATMVRPSNAPTGNDLAGATIDVNISADGQVIEHLTGSIIVEQNPLDRANPVVLANISQLAAALSNFRLVTPANSLSAIGYQWDLTDQLLTFPTSFGKLAPGASATLSYDTTVTSWTRGLCNSIDCAPMAYSGFGDPIGKGGGATATVPGNFALGGSVSSISGVTFSRFAFGLPQFHDGLLLFELPDTTPDAPVPEPESWTMLLLGAGLIGGLLRRRRVLGYA